MKPKKHRDKRSKSLAKAFSWRIIATVTTSVLVFIFTGHLELAFSVGIFDFILKILFYYMHERAWAHV